MPHLVIVPLIVWSKVDHSLMVYIPGVKSNCLYLSIGLIPRCDDPDCGIYYVWKWCAVGFCTITKVADELISVLYSAIVPLQAGKIDNDLVIHTFIFKLLTKPLARLDIPCPTAQCPGWHRGRDKRQIIFNKIKSHNYYLHSNYKNIILIKL